MADRAITEAEMVAARTFPVLVSQLEDGAIAAELDDKLQDLVTTMRSLLEKEHVEQKGKIKLEIDFLLEKDGTFEVRAKAKVDKPMEKHGKTTFFATGSNFLTRRDPRQMDLVNVRPVQMPSDEVRKLDINKKN